MQPDISVVVPIYGVEKYLKQCVDSILNQTFKNMEVILVDDGSRDRCPQMVDEYLPQADCVAITLPGTTATKGMFDAERMAKMKDGAILLNVGRGMIVDTDALCAALENGKLAGAGVDVTDPEPLPADHPLWKMENAVITPHISGGYHLQETHDRIVRIMAENLKRFLAGEPLRNVVDFSTGYRKL